MRALIEAQKITGANTTAGKIWNGAIDTVLKIITDPLPPGKYRIAVPGRQRCPKCWGSFIFVVHVYDEGGSFCDSYDHRPDCPILRCPHGILWADGCVLCEQGW